MSLLFGRVLSIREEVSVQKETKEEDDDEGFDEHFNKIMSHESGVC